MDDDKNTYFAAIDVCRPHLCGLRSNDTSGLSYTLVYIDYVPKKQIRQLSTSSSLSEVEFVDNLWKNTVTGNSELAKAFGHFLAEMINMLGSKESIERDFKNIWTAHQPDQSIKLKSRQTGLTAFMNSHFDKRSEAKDLCIKWAEASGTLMSTNDHEKSSESHQNHKQTKNQGVEMTSSSTVRNVLTKLAKIQIETDEFEHLTNSEDLGDELSKAVAELRVEERAQAVKEAAQMVLRQLTTGKELLELKRRELAVLRRKEAETIASIEYSAVAMAYGREKQNFLPLMAYNEANGNLNAIYPHDRVPEEDFNRLLADVRAKQREVNNQRATAKKSAAIARKSVTRTTTDK